MHQCRSVNSNRLHSRSWLPSHLSSTIISTKDVLTTATNNRSHATILWIHRNGCRLNTCSRTRWEITITSVNTLHCTLLALIKCRVNLITIIHHFFFRKVILVNCFANYDIKIIRVFIGIFIFIAVFRN